jgi:hypothetical protein
MHLIIKDILDVQRYRVLNLMKWLKAVIPAKAGIQPISNQFKTLDSRFHGNDPKDQFSTFDEIIKSFVSSSTKK